MLSEPQIVFGNCNTVTVTQKSFLETVILLYCNAWCELALSKKQEPVLAFQESETYFSFPKTVILQAVRIISHDVNDLSLWHLDFNVWFNIIKYKYVKEFHFCVIFLAKKFVLSMIIRIFATTESATLPIWTANQGGSFAFYGYIKIIH